MYDRIKAVAVIFPFIAFLGIVTILSGNRPAAGPLTPSVDVDQIVQGLQRAYAETGQLKISADLRRQWQEANGATGRRHYRAEAAMESDRCSLLVYDELREGKRIYEKETSAGVVAREAASLDAPEIDGCLFGSLQSSWFGPEEKRAISIFIERVRAGRYQGTTPVGGRDCHVFEHWIEEPAEDGEPAFFRRDVLSVDSLTYFVLGWVTEERYRTKDAPPAMRCERLYTYTKGDQ